MIVLALVRVWIWIAVVVVVVAVVIVVCVETVASLSCSNVGTTGAVQETWPWLGANRGSGKDSGTAAGLVHEIIGIFGGLCQERNG